MREYHYVVDREGRVFHDGTEITDPQVLRFFLLAMQRAPDGRHLVVCQGEHNWFEADGTPFVVQRLRLTTEGGSLLAADLLLAGGYSEALDPETLEGEGGLLFCGVRRGAFRARFGRVAMQQIAPHLADLGAGAALEIGGRHHPIRGADWRLAPPR
jgi:hypothetical protein